MELHCGMDLHGENVLCSLTDENDKVVAERRLPTKLGDVLGFLGPHRTSIVNIVVESTYNWYWLIDGLQAEKYPVSLANPNAIKAYDGLKHGNDNSDARHLAHLSRLGVLPTGYIYPREQRGIRDLLRRRMYLVQDRTGFILSLQALCERVNGGKIAAEKFKHMKPEALMEMVDDAHHRAGAVEYLEIVRRINQGIYRLETRVLSECRDTRQFELLNTIPGIGRILAMMIALASGPVSRFAAAGNYASYARTVNADRFSDRKKKAKKNGAVATKALACKLARCIYHMLTQEEAFAVKKMFG